MPKKYPKVYKPSPCHHHDKCPFSTKNPKAFTKEYPRYYGRKARCHYMGVYECPNEGKYPKSEKYDDVWPYPFFKRLW